ncbi:hypothetical protein JE959_001775 [Aeromonas veronii]|nr:hypothetical protein [Aeromonas veronii]
MNAIDFNKAITASFAKYFPNGFIYPSKLPLGGGTHFRAGIIGKQEDQANSIRDNDPLTVRFAIHEMPFNGEADLGNDKLVIEFNGSSLSTLPDSPYLAMGREKIPCRKINNTPEKALAALDKYFAKVHEVVKAQAETNNIYNQQNIKAEYLPA